MALLTVVAALNARSVGAQTAAQTTVLTPDADAYVDASLPKDRFGTSTALLAGATPVRRSYLRFDLTAIQAPVSKATLVLQAAGASLTGYEVRTVANTSWNERNIMFQNAPAVSTSVAASSGPSAAGSTSVDVTSITSAGRVLSIAITSQSAASLSFASREAGSTGPRLVVETQDLGAPAVTLTAPANGSSTNATTPTFAGAAGTAAGDSSTVTVNVYAGTAVSGTPVQVLSATASGGSWSAPATTALAEGAYTAQAEQVDDAGNVGRSSANTFTVDTTPPAVSLTTPSAGALTNSRTPALAGAAGSATGDSATVTVRIYPGTSATGTPAQTLNTTRSGGSWSATPSALADGTYTARAEQVDAAGNAAQSETRTFTIDATPPAVTLTSPANGSTGGSTPSFSGAAGTAPGDSATITVRVYSGTAASGTPVQTLQPQAAGGAWSATAAPLADGTYTARAEQGDTAGNTGLSAPTTFGVGSAPPPPPPPSVDYRGAVMADSPRAYWRLGESSGLVAADQTSNAIAGSYMNGVVLGRPGAVGGDPDTSIALDGVNDTVRVPNAAALNSSSAMSLETWLRPSPLPATSATLARKEGQYLVRLQWNGTVTFRLWKGTGITEVSTPAGAIAAGSWSHLAVTWDGATMRVYVNGAQRASGSLAAPANVTTQDLYFGSSYNSYDYYVGGLDEVAVYTAALSAARVQAHYTAATSVDTTPPSPTLASPANGSTMDARPTFAGSGGMTAGDAPTVLLRVYSGTAASGTPVQTLSATVQPASTFSVRAQSLVSGTYTAVAEQSDSGGLVGRSDPSTFTVDAGADPVVLAAGDIVGCDTFGDEATASLLDGLRGTVLTLGDHAYEDATVSDFRDCYDATWGRHKARTTPGVGDHEYRTPNATPYFNYFGAAAGDPAKGYYSYNLGAWHIVVLNATCAEIGGCGAGSPEEQWLRQDLTANLSACTLVVEHKPRFSSGSIHGSSTTYQPFWQAMYDNGVELVLGGDDHVYERFAPQTPTGVADPARGIRQITVGTGGRGLYSFGTIKANSEVRNNTTFGVLEVTLHPASYDWRFVPEAGRTFTDSGTTACH